LAQALTPRLSAGVPSRLPPDVRTRSAPGCVAISILPSGVKAIAVGEATVATDSSEKPAGTVAAGAAAVGAIARTEPASTASSQRLRRERCRWTYFM
jgi:hypothetical protein